MTASLYIGHVSHIRLQPFRHGFRYRVFSLWLDLDYIPQSLLFSHNRFNLLSFHDADHGDGLSPKSWAVKHLQDAGYAADETWCINLLCFPRLWGYVFNPIAVYYCKDSDGTLQAMLYQVSNTFGEHHSYLLSVDNNACEKTFHVSPFMPLDGDYRFKAPMPDKTLDLTIHYLDQNGDGRLTARQTGVQKPLNTRTILLAVISHPLMTFKVTAGIHWQAFKLWRKGARFFPKPPPPLHTVSSHSLHKVLPQ